ncbi:choice-of-anchor L domain-containing protein, partial [Flavobacterium sp. MFBS3-15]|uniref:choice-of-anchor L domain-containing protein n=1 Tax=Flavobacterium sp. MFBS3-15 TaxID=2989816 RepID=UPI0022354DCE
MKKILFFGSLLSSLLGFGQVITVNTTQTPTQLVNNVLVDNSCLVQISNIVTSTGSNFGSSNGIGSYQNTNPSFPVTSSGLLLTTGQASLSPGPNNSVLSNGGASATWLGNAELQATLAAAGITMQSKNATLFQFDFIPNSSNFGFDFLFASEEYGAFQCTTNDAFIVLLDNLDDPTAPVNVALIPSTTDPVTVANIRNQLYNSDCTSLNANWFGQFNGGSNAAGAAINYNGQTKLMHVSGTLVPNAHYRIKFIIADDAGTDGTDGDYDSAVFIPAGSLNLGHQIFEQDFTFANGNPLCYGQEYVLDTELDPAIYNFQWMQGSTVLAETGPALTIDEPGTYSVTLNRPSLGCVTTQSIVVQYAPEIPAQQANNLFKCENPTGLYTYDLSINTPVLKQGLNPNTIITYHADQDNASDDTNPLPLNYLSATGATIWARVENPDNGCYTLRSFQLLTSPPPTATQPTDLVLCETTQGSNSAVFNLNQQDSVILGAQPIAENVISYYTSADAANAGTPAISTPASFTGTNQTIYARIEKAFDSQCFSVTSFNLVVNPLPVLPAPTTVNACNSYTLPAIAGGSYFTGIGGTGTERPAGTVITTSQTLYAYAQSGGSPNCSNQSELVINIITASTAPSNVTACLSYILPALNPGEEYHSAPNGGGITYPAGHEITATQTVYFYIPAAAACTANNSFVVTITNAPTVVEHPDITQCTPYILPVLPNGQRYRTGPNNTGTVIPAGTSISTPQTIYIYASNPNNPACTAQSEFIVNIEIVTVPNVDDVEACNSYNLPNFPGLFFYSGPNGTGTQYNPGQSINTSMTLYVYKQGVSNPACTDEDSFTVTIHPLPFLQSQPNVTACNSYVLPAPPSNGQYFSGPNGTGSVLAQGTVITNTQVVYVLSDPNEFGCRRQRQFTVTIISVEAITPADQNVCYNYTLPALAMGEYRTQPNGGGTVLSAGTVISTSQTIYVRVVTQTTPVCITEGSFDVTITPRPNFPQPQPVITCGSYTLPALTVSGGTGGYYTGPNGTGTMLPAGTVINTSQNIFAYAQTGGTPNCFRQNLFSVTIIQNNSIAPPNVVSCGPYTLPALPLGNYRTAPNGGGSQINAGTVINTNQTIYTYVATTSGPNCTGDDSFTVTINPLITADNPSDVVSCTPYQLPALTNGNYFTGPNGTGTQLPVGTVITDSQTLYVYNSVPNTANCTAQNSFDVTIEIIDVNDMPDQLVCGGYVLPELPVGNYYTGPGGTGQQLNAGELIDSDQTIYIYAQTTTTPPCSDEESFEVVIKPAPVIDNPGNAGACGPYTLPALIGGGYFSGPGGTGTQYFAGQVITETTQLYIFAATGGTPNCTSENPFLVVINPEAPDDVAVCGEYELPPLEVGGYFTQPAGQGTQLFPGEMITTTQDIYVYVDLGTGPNCTDNNFFTVTVTPYPVLAPVEDVFICDNYELPALAVGTYYTAPNGTGNVLQPGSFITSTQPVYVYAFNGECISQEMFTVTIYNTPMVDARSDALACESYTLDHLIVGNYFTEPNGQGTPLFEGDEITTTQTIYIFSQSNTNPNCVGENSFLVEVFHANADDPADVNACDTYTLPALTEGSYYANSGGPNLADPSANPEIPAGTVLTAPYQGTLFVYSQTGGNRINCNDENSFQVNVYETPVVDEPADVAQCEAYALPALTVGTYRTGQGGTGTVLPVGYLVTSPMTIYVYASVGPVTNPNLCSDEHSFFVDVNIVTVPEYQDQVACGQYILPALAPSQGNYFTGPNGTGTMLSPGDVINTVGINTIYIYKQAGTTIICDAESSFEVNIIEAPVPMPTDPLVVCGIDDFGHGIFNLVPAMEQALGGQPFANVTIHETLADAQFDNEPISDDPADEVNVGEYRNVTAYNQTLYIRLESTLTACYNVGTVQLIVNPRPIATEPEAYALCDNGSNDTDGIAVFDLTTLEAEILGTLNPAQFAVSFYDADGLIPTPASYASASQVIIGRVTNTATGCYDEVDVELIVNPLPQAAPPAPYTLCDLNNPGDEVEEFDLNTKIDEIIGTQDGLLVTFFK